MGTIISKRKHPFYTKRMPQLDLNRLANAGGRDYIDVRLWRAPNETDTQWFGDKEEGIVGRKERTALVNDAQRITAKIRQYIFKKPVERRGVAEDFAKNCGGDNTSLDEFMGEVCDALTTGQWCWIQVDSTATRVDENGVPVAQTLDNKPRVFWRLWRSCAIPDWYIDEQGVIRWLIVRTKVLINNDPLVEAKQIALSTLFWIDKDDGKVHVTEEVEGGEQPNFALRVNEVLPDLDRIPFVLVGKPSPEAWWYDDVENIQAQILNYDSMHNETLTDAVYPQLVVPMGLLNTLETDISLDKAGAKKLIILQRELIKGRKNPFYEQAEEKGVTRYIQPNSGDLKMVVEEQDRKRKMLFDMCGLALFNRETRMVQTAESKSFDQLDTNATLGNRAAILEEAERCAVDLSAYFDSSFQKYEPAYNRNFDVVDVEVMSQSISTLSQLPNLTPKMHKLILLCAIRIVREIGGADEKTYNEVCKEIENTPDEEFANRNPFEDFDDPDDKGDDDDEPEDPDDPDGKKKGGKKKPPVPPVPPKKGEE